MTKHIHIHIHRPARTRDAVKPDPDREALVAALMEAIRAREGKTKDADFKEEDHPLGNKKKVADTPKQATSKAVHDPREGTHHVVTLPSGAVHKIQRLNSTESMGVPGFHVISGKEGWRGSSPTYLADTKQDAIRALQDRESRRK